MKIPMFGAALLASTIFSASAFADDVTLTVESWRTDDLALWQDEIIPAFEESHPGIKIKFSPTDPNNYDSILNSKLDAGSAGDVITCRAFDMSLALFQAGHLADLTNIDAMKNFSDVAKAAWQTDDGASTFCVPIASVIHGFIYNKDIFNELGLEVPKTEDQFFALLEKVKEDGSYIPLDMGTNDQWEGADMGFSNIGPNYWKGEEGRKALISGEQKLTDPEWVAPFKTLAKWRPYLGDGFEAQTYADSQNIFTLGRAAIYPAGSWEISGFNAQADFEMGAFKPPVQKEGDECYISDHNDIAIGLNPSSPNAEAALEFLNWVGSAEFAQIYSNALPGFFSLSNHTVELSDPLAQEFVSWRQECHSSIRPAYQILSRGTPNFDSATYGAAAAAIKGSKTPEEVAKDLQDGLASWYAPQQ